MLHDELHARCHRARVVSMDGPARGFTLRLVSFHYHLQLRNHAAEAVAMGEKNSTQCWLINRRSHDSIAVRLKQVDEAAIL